jgi:hypothetical protein
MFELVFVGGESSRLLRKMDCSLSLLAQDEDK